MTPFLPSSVSEVKNNPDLQFIVVLRKNFFSHSIFKKQMYSSCDEGNGTTHGTICFCTKRR